MSNTMARQAGVDAARTDALPLMAIPLLSLAAFSVSVSARIIDPLLPLFATEFNISLGVASAAVTLFAIAYGIAQIIFGPLGDRFGKYRVIALVSVASALSALLCGFALNFSTLLAGRLLAGLTAAAVIPLSMAWIGDVVPYQHRQTVLARFMVGQILGVSAGSFFGGLVADNFSWRLPFFVMALTFLATGIALLYLNRRLPARTGRVGRVAPSIFRLTISEFRQVFANPWAKIVLVCVFLEGTFIFGALSFIPAYIYEVFGTSLTAAGSLLMLFGLGGLSFVLCAKQVLRQFGERGVVCVGGLLAGISLIAMGLAPAWWWMVPCCFIAGFGFYLLHNTLQVNATQMAPERRGVAVSAFAASFYLGQATGVSAGGMLLMITRTSHVLVIGGAGVLLVAIAFFWTLRHRPVA
ncbi:MAG TPA: MFS transporter [Eoetvoesiella sp.]